MLPSRRLVIQAGVPRLGQAVLLGIVVLASAAIGLASEQPPLGKDEVRCGSESCTLGVCHTQALLRDPAGALSQLRIVPVMEKGTAVGFKLFGVRVNTLAARAGLRNGDVVTALNGHSVAGPQAALQAFNAVREETLIRMSLQRQGKTLERRLLLDRRKVAPGECSAPKIDKPAALTPATAPEPGDLARDIQCKGTRCTLKNGVLDRILADPPLLVRGARIVPAMVDGKPQGLTLYAIRPGSVYQLAGLENGDQIERIAGLLIDTPERALEAYSKLRGSSVIPVELRRKGVALTLTFEVER